MESDTKAHESAWTPDDHQALTSQLRLDIEAMRRLVSLSDFMKDARRAEARVTDMARDATRSESTSRDNAVLTTCLNALSHATSTARAYHSNQPFPVSQEVVNRIRGALTPDDTPAWQKYSDMQKDVIRSVRDDVDAIQAFAHQQWALTKLLGKQTVKPVAQRLGDLMASGTPRDLMTFSKGSILAVTLALAPPAGVTLLAMKASTKTAGLVGKKAINTLAGQKVRDLGNRVADLAEKGVDYVAGHFPQNEQSSDRPEVSARDRLGAAVHGATHSEKGAMGGTLAAYAIAGGGVSLALNGLMGTPPQETFNHLMQQGAHLFDGVTFMVDSIMNLSLSQDLHEIQQASEPMTHLVSSGDTLSQAIMDAYQDSGISLTDADLYEPGPRSEHPGGLVGQVAELNGLSGPDMIQAGDALNMGYIEVDTSFGIRSEDMVAKSAEVAGQDAGPAPTLANTITPDTDSDGARNASSVLGAASIAMLAEKAIGGAMGFFMPDKFRNRDRGPDAEAEAGRPPASGADTVPDDKPDQAGYGAEVAAGYAQSKVADAMPEPLDMVEGYAPGSDDPPHPSEATQGKEPFSPGDDATPRGEPDAETPDAEIEWPNDFPGL